MSSMAKQDNAFADLNSSGLKRFRRYIVGEILKILQSEVKQSTTNHNRNFPLFMAHMIQINAVERKFKVAKGMLLAL